jgi:hypothetical protein
VLHTTNHFEVPKNVGVDFVRLLCIYSSARKVVLVRFLVYKISGIFKNVAIN